MKLEEQNTIDELSQFICGTQKVIFTLKGNKAEKYHWITTQLIKFKYSKLGKKDKGVIIIYFRKVTNYSRSQTTRLIKKYIKHGKISFKHVANKGFKMKYTNADIRTLAKLDVLHDKPCGQRAKKLCERAFHIFNELEFERLSGISTSHLYNFRSRPIYQRLNVHYEKINLKHHQLQKDENHKLIQSPGIFELTQFIKGITVRKNEFTTITLLMKLLSLKWSLV